MRVLIVEPSKDLAKVIGEYLRKEDITSDIAHSSQTGITKADKNKPDAVILELLINGHNGLEFIHEFKSYNDWFDVPIIVYSELSAEELGSAVGLQEDMSIVRHFYKPTTTLEDLKNTLKSLRNEE